MTPSWWNHLHDHQKAFIGRSRSRSTHDRGPLLVWSWLFWSKIVAHSMPILKPQRRPKEPLPRPLQIASTTTPIAHNFGLKSSFKSHVFLPCSWTFDRFVKKLSKFWGRSLVHRDPPAFRLDCVAIGVGLITNFSLISSNFPLEFRTSTRKNLNKFASIHKN